MAIALETKKLTKRFGGLTAVNEVDLVIQEGSIHGLIGPNGSGKSTFINVINGILPIDGGEVFIFGNKVSGLSSDRIARLGVARTFQNVGLFSNLSVLDNARSGRERHNEYGLLGALIRGKSVRKSEDVSLSEAKRALEHFGLDGQEIQTAGSLPYGRQRLLEFARAMILRPKLLLLDEPVAGMPPNDVAKLSEIIRDFNKNGTTILLLEHNMEFTMSLCDRLSVLNFGSKIAEGTPSEIQNNPEVIEAYLGSTEMEPAGAPEISYTQKQQPLLSLENVTAFYGEIQGIRQISMDVFEGEIVTVLGPNGAGKSTILRSISGLFSHLDGDITFDGSPIQNLAANRIASRGIAHVPEGRRVFPGLTVFENLEVASTAARKNGYSFKDALDEVYKIFPVLGNRKGQLGWSLSGGEQQMLVIARGLISKPRILLLDEPSLGLAPKLVEELYNWIRNIHQMGVTILLVEQNAKLAMALASRAYVLSNGEIVASGTVQELTKMDFVKKAYFGG